MQKKNKLDLKKTIYNLKYVFRLLLILKKRYLIFSVVISILVTIVPFATLLLSQELLNGIQSNKSTLNSLVIVLCLYIFVQFLGTVVSILQGYCMGKYNEYLSCELSKYFDRLCSKLTLRDFETDTTYDMIQRAEYEMGMRPFTMLGNLLSLMNGILGLSFSIVILINWHLWILVGFILLPIACFNYFKKVSDLEYKTVYERTAIQRKSWYLTYLLTKDYYIKEVRTLGLTKYLLDSKFKIKDYIYNQNIRILKKKNYFKVRYQLLNFLFLFVIILTALTEVFYRKIMIGNFMTYISTSSKVEGYINSITDSLFALYTDSLYCENIVSFIKYAETKYSENEKEELILKSGIETVELKNLSYKYPGSNSYVLNNINLKINCNDIVAFVGENGSGKTTLIKLILGIYDDYEGDILINNENLKNINKESYLGYISTIFQDYNNYEFTIKENIRFGDIKNNVNDEKIISSAKLANADNFINKLPNKYDQQVGNWFAGGMQLSGGQWQKLALSRGIIKNSDLYIFDEPTSSLDPSSEYIFFKNMLTVFKNKIGIFVTHRFINAKVANKIIVFKGGNIIEMGEHDELMKNKSYYFKMYNLQQEGITKKDKELV